MTINFLALSWAVRSRGQDDRNHARKALVSPTPVIKIGVLLGCSPAGRQGLATWASKVVPTGMPLRGPDMSVDMRPGAVSEETVGSDGSNPLAVGLSCPLGLCGAEGAATTAVYVALPSEDPSCRPPVAACSPVAPVEVAGSGADPALGASLQALKIRPSWPARWLCTSPQPWLMNGGRLWTRLQKWCCGSQPAQSACSGR